MEHGFAGFAVLWPERFRVNCAFGDSRSYALPQNGRHYKELGKSWQLNF